MSRLTDIISEYKRLGIPDQIDYDKLYLYSIITHSTAVEGSTVTEIENQLMFDEGITPNKPLVEQLMNLDLKNAYTEALSIANQHIDYSVKLLCHLSGMVMKNTGTEYKTMLGSFNSAKGDLRLLNVKAGRGGKSYMSYQKVPQRLEDYCNWLNLQRKNLSADDIEKIYELSFLAHYNLVYIHPWADGNGRMSRLVMNMLQLEFGVIPSIVKKESREEYIKSLDKSQSEGNSTAFIEFMLEHHIDNLENSITEYRRSIEEDTLNLKNDTINDANDTINDTLNQSAKERQILNLIKSDNNITIMEIINKTGFSRPTVTRAIKTMKEQHILERSGARKNGYWVVH
ncbi:MAG: Fic family protein [Lachnospiraceae bacterium]|nr:Fic family protein [Lachnospiraceae bacterium]